MERCYEDSLKFGDKSWDVFDACCKNAQLCNKNTAECQTFFESKITSAGSDELFVFYRPYDPLCPDRKRGEECLEILDNDYQPTAEDLTTEDTSLIGDQLFL